MTLILYDVNLEYIIIIYKCYKEKPNWNMYTFIFRTAWTFWKPSFHYFITICHTKTSSTWRKIIDVQADWCNYVQPYWYQYLLHTFSTVDKSVYGLWRIWMCSRFVWNELFFKSFKLFYGRLHLGFHYIRNHRANHIIGKEDITLSYQWTRHWFTHLALHQARIFPWTWNSSWFGCNQDTIHEELGLCPLHRRHVQESYRSPFTRNQWWWRGLYVVTVRCFFGM